MLIDLPPEVANQLKILMFHRKAFVEALEAEGHTFDEAAALLYAWEENEWLRRNQKEES